MNSLHVVFDWDGTLSFIRAGWGEVMLRQWLEFLPPAPGESAEAREAMAHREIWALNGRPSIHQMERLGGLVAERGGLSVHSYGIAERCFEIARDYAKTRTQFGTRGKDP